MPLTSSATVLSRYTLTDSSALARVHASRIVSGSAEDATGCLIWRKAKNADGYGVMKIGSTDDGSRRTVYVHRLMYEIVYGPVPTGLEVSHVAECGKKLCVLPEHLLLRTHLEVVRAGSVVDYNRSKTECPQGHAYNQKNTYRYPDGRRACRECRRVQH